MAKTYAERLADRLRKSAERDLNSAAVTAKHGAFIAAAVDSAEDDETAEWAEARAKSMADRAERKTIEATPLKNVTPAAAQALLDALGG